MNDDAVTRMNDEALRAFVEDLGGLLRARSSCAARLSAATRQIAPDYAEIAASLATDFADIQPSLLRLEKLAQQAERLGQAATRAGRSAAEAYEASVFGAKVAEAARLTSDEMADRLSAIGLSLQHLKENVGRLDSLARLLENALVEVAELAQQANLLAINANIEAARGELGAGFGKAAGQMTLLARTTGDAARRIGTLAQEIVRRNRATFLAYSKAEAEADSAVGSARDLQQAAATLQDGARALLESSRSHCSAVEFERVEAARIKESLAESVQRARAVIQGMNAVENLVWQQGTVGAVMTRHSDSIAAMVDGAEALVATAQTAPGQEDVYRAALPRAPQSLDPAYADDSASLLLLGHVFCGLVRRAPGGRIVPALAASWKLSAGGKALSFRLRPGALFSDGRPLQAADVKRSLERIMNPSSRSPHFGLFSMIRGAEDFMRGNADEIAGIRAAGDGEVVLEFDGPFGLLLSALAHPAAGAIVGAGPSHSGPGVRPPAGIGPFRFAEIEADGLWSLEACENYFEGRPFADRLEFRLMESYDERRGAFDAGKLSHVDIDGGVLEAAKRDEELHERLLLMREPEIIFGRFSESSFFQDSRVRQALNLIIDRGALVADALGGMAVPSGALVPFGIPGHDPEFPGFGCDASRAGRLLAETGLAQGWPRPLTIGAASPDTTLARLAQGVAAQLQRAGVAACAAEQPGRDGDIIIDRCNGAFDPDGFFRRLLGSGAVWEVPNLEALVDAGRAAGGPGEQQAAYRRLQERVMADPPFLFLAHSLSGVQVAEGVFGLVLGPGGSFDLRRTWMRRKPRFEV